MTLDLAKLKEAAEKARPSRHAGYMVTDDGHVMSTVPWRGCSIRLLSSFPNSHGYPAVKVKTASGMRKALIHTMVCEAFHGPKPSALHEVRHLDGNKTNNKASNLAWGTRAENAADRIAHGTNKSAENGRVGAEKMRGVIRSEYCKHGHHKEGRRSCNACRRKTTHAHMDKHNEP